MPPRHHATDHLRSVAILLLCLLIPTAGCREPATWRSSRLALSNDSAAEAGSQACDDGDPATVDSEHPTLGCCHRATRDFDGSPVGDCPGPGCDPSTTAPIATCGDVQLDTSTNIVWSPGKLMKAGEMTVYCGSLAAGGLSGWQVPTVDEARTLFANCAAVLPGGSCKLTDPGCLQQGAACACGSCVGGPKSHGAVLVGASRYYCKPGLSDCLKFGWTGSDCPNCGTSPQKRWSYQFINGAIVAMDVASMHNGRCYIQLASVGESCTKAQECASGHCVGGVCCESACRGGSCAGGTCVPSVDATVPDAPRPGLDAPSGADALSPDGSGGRDAGAPGAAAADDDGCDCRLGARQAPNAPFSLVLVITLLAVPRRSGGAGKGRA